MEENDDANESYMTQLENVQEFLRTYILKPNGERMLAERESFLISHPILKKRNDYVNSFVEDMVLHSWK